MFGSIFISVQFIFDFILYKNEKLLLFHFISLCCGTQTFHRKLLVSYHSRVSLLDRNINFIPVFRFCSVQCCSVHTSLFISLLVNHSFTITEKRKSSDPPPVTPLTPSPPSYGGSSWGNAVRRAGC